MSQCFKTSNNKFVNLPPRMDDGRHFTDYRPNCVVNGNLKVENKVLNSYEYRMYLTQNATKIMDTNKKLSYAHNGAYDCADKDSIGTMLPEENVTLCNTQNCEVLENFVGGVGLGRQHSEINECIKPSPGNEFNMKDNSCVPKDNKL